LKLDGKDVLVFSGKGGIERFFNTKVYFEN